MTGYTPLFSSLTTGTLCGRWPDVGLWPIVLSLADRHGVVDVTPDFLARVTGLPVDDVAACLERFCEPDPYSRSTAEGGARLALIDPASRPWGWRVVNHGKYRERARKRAFDAERTVSGRDAERKRRERVDSRDVPTRPDSPDDSRESPPSDSDSDSDKDIRNSRPLERTAEFPKFHQEVVDAYHEILPNAPRVKVWTKPRKQALDARIRERCQEGKPAESIAYWRALFEKVAASDFLSGRSNNFRADIEWIITARNFTKVIEDKYANRNHGDGGSHG